MREAAPAVRHRRALAHCLAYSLAIVAGASLLALLQACGQRGPLYLPDRNARVVTHPASSAPESSGPAATDSAPAPQR